MSAFIVSPRAVSSATNSAISSAANSPRESRRSSAQSAEKDSSSWKQVAKSAAAALKKHHQEVNRAFDSVYGTKYYTRAAQGAVDTK